MQNLELKYSNAIR